MTCLIIVCLALQLVETCALVAHLDLWLDGYFKVGLIWLKTQNNIYEAKPNQKWVKYKFTEFSIPQPSATM